MMVFFRLFVVILFSAIGLISCNITEISSFLDFNFEKIKAGDLVVFDLDNTLIRPNMSIFLHWESPLLLDLETDFLRKEKGLNTSQIISLKKHFLSAFEQCLVEDCIVDIIEDLQKRGAIVIACTNIKLEKIIHKEKIHLLNNLGIIFNFEDEDFCLRGDWTNRPLFYRGIIFTDLDPCGKGPLIDAVICKLGIRPRKVFMFDDQICNLANTWQTLT